MGDIVIWSIPTVWQFPELFLMFLPMTRHKKTSEIPDIRFYLQSMGMVGEACLPSNAYYPRTPDYTLYSGVHVCWSEHSDSSFIYGFMSLDYGLGTMTTTTNIYQKKIMAKIGLAYAISILKNEFNMMLVLFFQILLWWQQLSLCAYTVLRYRIVILTVWV